MSGDDQCNNCEGKRWIQEDSVVEVPVTPGLAHGDSVRLVGKGDFLGDDKFGDLVGVIIRTDENDCPFVRKGDDLFVEHQISLSEALTGFAFILAHLDGRQILVKSVPGAVAKSGDLKLIHGEGMPMKKNPSLKGDLVVALKVEFPSEEFLTPEIRSQLEKLLPPKPVLQEGLSLDEYIAQDFDEAAFVRRQEQQQSAEEESAEQQGGGRAQECSIQ